METNEWGWFRASLTDALVRPRRFAGGLAREHYGLAGVLIGLVAGVALSVTIDVAVILSKEADPLVLVSRLILDALGLGVRLDVVLALLALIAVGAARLARREISLDQAFTALSFATAPLLFAPAIAVLMVFATEFGGEARGALFALAGILAGALVLRVALAVALNLAALVHGATVIVAGLALLAAGFVLQDQISRVSFTVLSYAPTLLAPPAASAVAGERVEVVDVAFTIPPGWVKRATGAPGVAAQYELPDMRLIVLTEGVSSITAPGEFASSQSQRERRDFASVDRTEQRFVRIDSTVGLEELWHGRIGATPVTERLYTFVIGARGYVFQFFLYSPRDEAAALDEIARIATSIQSQRPR